MSKASSNTLDAFRREARLSHNVLWMRYFELGGMSSAFQLDAYLHDALQPSRHEHDVIAQALNERFVEPGATTPSPTRRTTTTRGPKARFRPPPGQFPGGCGRRRRSGSGAASRAVPDESARGDARQPAENR
jgi:hypothetical protein